MNLILKDWWWEEKGKVISICCNLFTSRLDFIAGKKKWSPKHQAYCATEMSLYKLILG